MPSKAASPLMWSDQVGPPRCADCSWHAEHWHCAHCVHYGFSYRCRIEAVASGSKLRTAMGRWFCTWQIIWEGAFLFIWTFSSWAYECDIETLSHLPCWTRRKNLIFYVEPVTPVNHDLIICCSLYLKFSWSVYCDRSRTFLSLVYSMNCTPLLV